MALDGANFIAELSITDPPGSDPLSQGDDQIRTIKRATFQSFPLIAAAVNITDVQMNLMAIKNEANVFTAAQTIQDNVMVLNAAADVGVSYQYHRAGLLRWSMSMVADAGTNDWSLTRFDDLGAFIDLPIDVNRVSGIVNFASVPTIQGDPIWTAGELKMLVVGSTPPSTNWFVTDGLNGTVDLRERFIAPLGSVFTGGAVGAFLAAKTDAGLLTGSHVLTDAQMPSHIHSLLSGVTGTGTSDTTLLFSSLAQNDTVIAGNRENQNATYKADNNNNLDFMLPAGADAGHTHTLPEQNVEADGSGSANVVPFSYYAIFVQYVP